MINRFVLQYSICIPKVFKRNHFFNFIICNLTFRPYKLNNKQIIDANIIQIYEKYTSEIKEVPNTTHNNINKGKFDHTMNEHGKFVLECMLRQKEVK